MEKQEQILNAALKLFVEFGFHGTPTSKIAKEAGVSNGTLFHYYPTKDELVLALYVHIKTKMAACTELMYVENETIKATFKRMFMNIVQFSLEKPTEFRFVQQFHFSPYCSMVSNEKIEIQVKKQIDFIENAIDNKVFKSLPIVFLMTMLNSHISGIHQYLSCSNLDSENQNKMLNTAFDLIWEMIT